VAIPRFHHELPPARLPSKIAWSLAGHAVAVILLVRIANWLPPAYFEPKMVSQVTPLYVPPTPPAVTIVAPPPKILARLAPPEVLLPTEVISKRPVPVPEPKIEPPRIEERPKTFEALQPPEPPKPELKKEVVVGAFQQNAAAAVPAPPRKEVVAAAFVGSSAPVTSRKPPQEVQTGGFGDVNGVKGSSEKKGALTVASLGGFDLPAGAGNGNGSGGSRGAQGAVASAGFGNMAAANPGDRRPQGAVAQAGFNEMSPVPVAPKARADEKPSMTPVEILYKPRPVYTQEARDLHLEGEVVVSVTFVATGELRVQQVVKGLGHGLDEAALRAARQIRFRPALRDGQPYDYAAQVRIVFALAE